MAYCSNGIEHALFLDTSGSVWGCGTNNYGGLGANPSSPEKISNLPPIVSVSALYYSSLFVDTNGDVWSCGHNHFGELGVGDNNRRNLPEKIPNLSKITSAIGIGHSALFLDSEGSVWGCGKSDHGGLGFENREIRILPEKIEGLPKITAIAGGTCHTLFLDDEGSVWTCGTNAPPGFGFDEVKTKPEKIEGLPKITKIAGGITFSMFLDEAGNVWTCGSNKYGELGINESFIEHIPRPEKIRSLSDIVAFAGGYHISAFLDKHGNLFTCGYNEFGQLGHGDKHNRNKPEKVEGIPPIAELSTINSSYYVLQVVDMEGRVWACGRNDCGQLGVGDKVDRTTLAQVEGIPSVGKAKGGN